jgi:hypothetical protein
MRVQKKDRRIVEIRNNVLQNLVFFHLFENKGIVEKIVGGSQIYIRDLLDSFTIYKIGGFHL